MYIMVYSQQLNVRTGLGGGDIHNAMVKEPICKKDSFATLLKAGGI